MSASENETVGLAWRKVLVTIGIALALLVAVVALIGQVASFHELLAALRRADKSWFPLCLGGEALAYAGYIAAYRDVARVDGGPRLPLRTAARIVAVGFGAFVAGSSAGTLGVDYWALHRAGEKPHVAARRVLALNTIEWAVLAAFACAAAAALLAGAGDAPRAMELVWLLAVPACVAAALWVSSPARAERLASLPHDDVDLEIDPRTWARWLRHSLRAGFADAVGGVVIVRHLLGRPGRHPGALVGYPLYWAGDMLTLWAALKAFGVHPGLAELVLAYTSAYVVTALPLPAGGAGGVEAGLAFALNAVAVPLAPALLGTLVYRFFTLWLPIGPALAAVTHLGPLSEELPRLARGPGTSGPGTS